MFYKLVVVSKAWNTADLINGQIQVDWSKDLDIEMLEYQIREEEGLVIYRSDNEEDIIQWLNRELASSDNKLI